MSQYWNLMHRILNGSYIRKKIISLFRTDAGYAKRLDWKFSVL